MAYRTSTINWNHISSTITTAGITSVAGDVGVIMASSAGLTTVSDSNSNTWTAVGSSPYTSAGGATVLIYAWTSPLSTVGSGHTATVGTGGPGYDNVLFFGTFSGRNTSSILDGSMGTFTDSGFVQSHAGPAITTSNNGTDIVAFCTSDGQPASDTLTPGGGYTQASAYTGDGTTSAATLVQYQNNVNSGTNTAAWSTGLFVKAGAIIIGIKLLPTVAPLVPGAKQTFVYETLIQY
jgi:hypothetical protein